MGEGSGRPSGQGLLWRERAGSEGYTASWNLGRLGAKARGLGGGWGGGGGQSTNIYRALVCCSQDVVDHERGQQTKPGGPDPVQTLIPTRMGVGMGGWEQGPRPWDSFWLQTQNHRAPSSWAGAQSHSPQHL